MKRRLVELARQAFTRLGYEVRSRSLAERQQALETVLPAWIRGHSSFSVTTPTGALGVVFSKDRALQLHALLESWFAQVEGTARLTILWTASPDHEASYAQLQKQWAGRVDWVREGDFRTDLLRIVQGGTESHLFFLTDDALVLRPWRLREVLRDDTLHEVFALTHGPELDWCFIEGKAQRVPPLRTLEDGLLEWDWEAGDPRMDWRFPLSVDGKFFGRREMALLLEPLRFRSPNTLEMALQAYLPLFLGRKGLCFRQACLVNVPCNAVQTEFDNAITGRHSTGDLLRRWNEGERIVWEAFQGRTPREAEGAPYVFSGRSDFFSEKCL